MRLLDKSKKVHIDETCAPPQMVDVPIGPPCCVVLTNSKSTGKNAERRTSESQPNCLKRYKSTLLIGTVTVLLLLTLLKLLLYFMIIQRDYNLPVDVQPESRAERVIRLSFPLGKRAAFSQLKTAGTVNNEDLPSTQRTTSSPTSSRSKREISRTRRECKLNEEHCRTLLKSMKSYLDALSKGKSAYAYEDIVKCLRCKDLKTNEISKQSLNSRPYERYQENAQQNRSSDYGSPIVKLLDDKEAGNGTECANDNQTEKTRPTDAAIFTTAMSPTTETSASSTGTADEVATTVHSNDPARSSASPPWDLATETTDVSIISSINAMKQAARAPSTLMNLQIETEKTPSNESIGVESSKTGTTTEKNRVSQQLTSSTRSSAMQYSIVSADSAISGQTTVSLGESSETTTPTIGLANQIATNVTEHVTSMPQGGHEDVTGNVTVNDTVHPSAHPSREGHPEATTNEARARDGYYPINNAILLNHLQANKNKENNRGSIMESTKSFQELQLTPPISWTTQPVCFFGYPGQPFNRPFPPGVMSHTGSFVPTGPQDQRVPSSFRNTSPNYMQVQAQTVQFLPRNNPGNRLQAQPSGVGPTGPAVINNAPIFPMNREPPSGPHSPEIAPQSAADIPYFCTYMPMPTYNFPPIPDTLQTSRSSNKVEPESPSYQIQPKSTKPTMKSNDGSPRQSYYAMQFTFCPAGYRQCDNRDCVPNAKWCDGCVDCADASDEIGCSCRNRIRQSRLCDGYLDCPNGEDELDCFDCSADFFNCNDSENSDRVPLKQRCDGIKQCLNGKDELDCYILSPTRISQNTTFPVAYTEGFLHKNIQGQWYPVCSNTSYWASEACISETGEPLTTMPQMSLVPANLFQDPHVAEVDGKVQFTSSESTVFVKCPPLSCGTRIFASYFQHENDYVSRHSPRQTASQQFYRETLDLLKDQSESKEDRENAPEGESQPRVVGGRKSQANAWPFLVAIYKDGKFHCGGVIINEVFILTAAHCMTGYQQHYYEIEAGVLRRFSFSPMAQLRRATYIMLHPNYELKLFRNDVALVMLDKAFIFNRWVRPICLPTLSTAGPKWEQGPTPQSICVAVGWGAVAEYGPDPDHLQEVAVPILSTCKHLADQNNSTICAGYAQGGHDACQGDSGGPLLCRNPKLESQWYVAGIISHGDGCGRPNEPGVYTKVSYFVDWIQGIFKFANSESFYAYVHLQSLSMCPGFNCPSGSKRCLSITKRCDGIVNCLHGEDEIDCKQQMSGYYRLNSNNETVRLISKNKNFAAEADSSDKLTTKSRNRNHNKETPNIIFDSLDSSAEDNSNRITANGNALSKPTIDHVRLTFTCKRLIQTITIDKRCDRNLDCEDGSDEEDCTCRDYLSNMQPSAICDKHVDCMDGSDEKDCDLCEGKYQCLNGECIPMAKKCDGRFDCKLKDDEMDCLALTNGDYINLDRDNRSALRMDGLLSRYFSGTWRVQCVQSKILQNDTIQLTMGQNLCVYLGFSNLQSVEKIIVEKTILETRYWYNDTSYRTGPPPNYYVPESDVCETLWIRCGPVLNSNAETYMVVNPKTGNHQYLWPWLAAIFVDGHYRCSALLLESDWLLSSTSCTKHVKLSVNYTVALFGQSLSYMYVDGPHQQISLIDEIRNVKSNLSLLHLKTPVNFTRHVQPLFLEKKIYPPAENNLCVAVGTNKEHVTQSIFMQPIVKNCKTCYRCFKELTCPVNGSLPVWSGTVFCLGKNRWYPAASFHEEALCNLGSVRNWTSIDYIQAYLTQALERKLRPVREPTCKGVRCSIGQCVAWNRVCDGVTDCRDGADETRETCDNKHEQKQDEMTGECMMSQLQCASGQCISKGSFCDDKVDCFDGTDEPVRCTCAEYLRLTAPNRLCDGVWHCLDKSDESPEECNCTETSFKCNTNGTNPICISRDFVCDGYQDCPNGEDEEQCIKVQALADDKPGSGEVVQRSYGVWHSRCTSVPMTKSEQAKSVCQQIGYKDGNILQVNLTSVSEPLIPSRNDDFYMVRINPDTWVTMRNDKPFVKLVRPTETCHRQFVNCF